MSLQVWLPLITNLNNQGCGAATISAPSTTFTLQKGKIGNASYTASSTITVNLPSIASSRIWSVTFWAYAVSANITANWTRVIRIADGGDMFRVEVCPSSYNSGQNCYSTHNNAAYKIAQGSVGSPSGGYYDQWFHMAITCDGTTISVYHNGTLRGTQNYTGDGAITGYFYIENSDKTYKNDFRIYDECLSPKQVKTISQGLVVHYPLDANGLGVPNLADNTNTFATGWSVGSGWTKGISDDGTAMYSFSRTGATSNNWVRLIPTELKVDGNNYPNGITVSMELLTPDKSVINQKCLGSLQQYNAEGTRTGWYEPGWDLTNVVNNKWSRISYTFSKSALLTNSQGLTYAYTQFSFQLVQNGNISIRKIMIAEGNKAQPYTLSLNDTGTIEIDTTGFKYNGTRVSVINDSADSPRYSCCTRFPTTTHIKYRCEITNMYHATYSMWVKFNTITNYGGFHMQYNNPSGGAVPWFAVNTEGVSLWCYFGGNSPNYTKAGPGDIQTGKWYHIVYVWNNGVAQWYLNGTKYGNSVTYTGKTYIQNNVDTSLGDSYTGSSWNGTPFDGWISDFRLYATALSDVDIKDLYQTSASIDNEGNILGYEFDE